MILHPPHTVRKRLLFLFLVWLFAAILPRPAFAALSLEDERKLGKEFYDKLVKGHFVLQNTQANAYLTLLGERILSHSDKAPFEFKFSIIRSSAINAFATPGGYVYLNQGLINLVESEGELAGVIAHEVAHVNGRHIADIVDKSQKINMSTLAAVLAGMFLGGGGELSAAVASFSMATATALSLQYSRQHEESADRMGLSYLMEAGYDGRAMVDFLKIMRRYEYYSNTVPSYFLTHPGTDERNRYIDGLLQTTRAPSRPSQRIGDLPRIQTILLLDAKPPDANIHHFQKLVKDQPQDLNALYGLAITEERLGMVADSLDHFRKALRIAPDDPDIRRDLGIALFKLGQWDEARTHLSRAGELRGDDPNANLYLGKTLLAQGDPGNAIRLFKKLEEERPDDPESWYNLAMAYGKTGETGESHYYFGLYFKKTGKVESALFHFKAARKEFSQNQPKVREIQKEIDSLLRPKTH